MPLCILAFGGAIEPGWNGIISRMLKDRVLLNSQVASIYIVVLNYNGWKDTIDCLESILLSSFRRFSVVVVDNSSTDNSLQAIEKWLEGREDVRRRVPFGRSHIDDEAVEIELINAARNGGYAYGNNLGIQYALSQDDCSHVWLLNNDTVINPETLNEMISEFTRLSASKKLGLLGCIQRYYSDPSTVQAVAGGFNKWLSRFWNIGADEAYTGAEINLPEFDYIYGASVLISRSCLEDVGPLNEDYFMYFEEIDFAERAKNKGYEMDVASRVSILHKYRSSVSKQSSGFQEYYLRRNTIAFYRTHYPILMIIPILKILALAAKYAFSNLALSRIYLRAVFDALKGKKGNTFERVVY